MNRLLSPWLAAAFAVAFLTVGLPYWRIPYKQVSLPGNLIGFGLLAVAAAAAVSRWRGRTSILATTLIVGAAVPCAVLARVALEVMSDPTSHNLWPFEVVFAAVPGLAASAVGVLIGSLFLRLSVRNAPTAM